MGLEFSGWDQALMPSFLKGLEFSRTAPAQSTVEKGSSSVLPPSERLARPPSLQTVAEEYFPLSLLILRGLLSAAM